MADLRLVKIVTGEFVIGYDNKSGLRDIAAIQIVPQQSGSLSLGLMPFGFPFEQEVGGVISESVIIYEVKDIPAELQNKYLELKSDIRIAKPESDGKIIL